MDEMEILTGHMYDKDMEIERLRAEIQTLLDLMKGIQDHANLALAKYGQLCVDEQKSDT